MKKKYVVIIVSIIGLAGSVASIYSFLTIGGDSVSTSGNSSPITNSPVIKAGGDVSLIINELKKKGVTIPDGEYYEGVAYLRIKLESLQAIRPAVVDRLPMSLAELHKSKKNIEEKNKTFMSVIVASKNSYIKNCELYSQIKYYFNKKRKNELDGLISSIEKTLQNNAPEAAKSSQLEGENLDITYKEYMAMLLVMVDFNIKFVKYLDIEIKFSIEKMAKLSK